VEKRDAEIVQKRDSGASYRVIASEFGLSLEQVTGSVSYDVLRHWSANLRQRKDFE
jgi:hypothetical protein